MDLNRSELQQVRAALYSSILKKRAASENGDTFGIALRSCEMLYAKITDALENLDEEDQRV